MRIILRTMDLPGKSTALYRPRKFPIELHVSSPYVSSLPILSIFFVQGCESETINQRYWQKKGLIAQLVERLHIKPEVVASNWDLVNFLCTTQSYLNFTFNQKVRNLKCTWKCHPKSLGIPQGFEKMTGGFRECWSSCNCNGNKS